MSAIDFAAVDDLGSICSETDSIQHHIDAIRNLPLVDIKAIQTKGFKIVVDGVNSSGGIAVPQLLEALGAEVVPIHCEPNGTFPTTLNLLRIT